MKMLFNAYFGTPLARAGAGLITKTERDRK